MSRRASGGFVRSALVFLLLAGASAIFSTVVLMLVFMRHWGLTPVEGPIPDDFPVLLYQPGPACSVVLWRDLDAARKRTPAWSYTAPTEDLAACISQLRPDASVQIETVEGARQRIAATSSPGGDEVNTSRYLAIPDHIEPISHQRFFGPGLALIAVSASVPVGVVVGALCVWFDRRRRRIA
jgi:hypothetical protein